MTEPAISMTRFGADVWRLTAGRATYLPTELRRNELQRAERTPACKNQEPRFLRRPIRAASRLALWPRDRHRSQRNTSDHSMLRCLMLGKNFNRISLRQLSFRRFRLPRCSKGYRVVWRLHQPAPVKASNETREVLATAGRTDDCTRKQFNDPSNFGKRGLESEIYLFAVELRLDAFRCCFRISREAMRLLAHTATNITRP
jgi:hypothetical protein